MNKNRDAAFFGCENELDPYLYLVWVLKEAPVRFAADRDWAESLLPQYAPDFCKA